MLTEIAAVRSKNEFLEIPLNAFVQFTLNQYITIHAIMRNA